eukprot:CAMPEP_0184215406 /NCGR_PEP_ID=MMETSP0976-20121227/15147_1 /TAXON_ID=483370 /ORGANISM="non described non described, Strain CCMP2097" /LENGTH=380 /DNA_ID=CAMNT_0026520177 /DNA_START=120 /DNA_END=1259 /DNA_ORIENTATION=-
MTEWSLTVSEACAVLGVGKGASEDEVRVAFKKLALTHHPDKVMQRGASEDEIAAANERIQEINGAKERLLAWLKDGFDDSRDAPAERSPAQPSAAYRAYAPPRRAARSTDAFEEELRECGAPRWMRREMAREVRRAKARRGEKPERRAPRRRQPAEVREFGGVGDRGDRMVLAVPAAALWLSTWLLGDWRNWPFGGTALVFEAKVVVSLSTAALAFFVAVFLCFYNGEDDDGPYWPFFVHFVLDYLPDEAEAAKEQREDAGNAAAEAAKVAKAAEALNTAEEAKVARAAAAAYESAEAAATQADSAKQARAKQKREGKAAVAAAAKVEADAKKEARRRAEVEKREARLSGVKAPPATSTARAAARGEAARTLAAATAARL